MQKSLSGEALTLRELELFYHLCDNPHISRLAKEISMSQSAISLAIKSLEKKLGEPLFDRVGKKLVLSERGRLFRQETFPHYLALKDAESHFQQERLAGIMKIASSKTVGNFIMPPLIFDFTLKNPSITIHREIHNSAQIIQMVREGEIDLGIIETECDEPMIVKEKFGSDRLVVVTSEERLTREALYIDQLAEKKWLLREAGSGTRELFLQELGSIAEELNIFMEFTEFEEMKTILEEHRETLACISRFVVEKELARRALFEVALKNITFERNLYIIYHREKYRSHLFNAFKAFIKARFTERFRNA